MIAVLPVFSLPLLVTPSQDNSYLTARYIQSGLTKKAVPVPTFPDRTQVVAQQKADAEAARIAAEAQQAIISSQATISVSTPPKTSHTGDGWEQLRLCEAGGDYTKNTGNGYYGAYQYDIGTWANFGGYARADLAPPAVQDAKAQATFAARGSSPWPVCGRFL